MDNLDEKELARAIFGDESDEEEERKEVEEAQEEQGEPKIDERTLDLQDDLEEPRDAGRTLATRFLWLEARPRDVLAIAEGRQARNRWAPRSAP